MKLLDSLPFVSLGMLFGFVLGAIVLTSSMNSFLSELIIKLEHIEKNLDSHNEICHAKT